MDVKYKIERTVRGVRLAGSFSPRGSATRTLTTAHLTSASFIHLYLPDAPHYRHESENSDQCFL